MATTPQKNAREDRYINGSRFRQCGKENLWKPLKKSTCCLFKMRFSKELKLMVQRLLQKSQFELLNCSAHFSWNNTRQTSNSEQTLEKWSLHYRNPTFWQSGCKGQEPLKGWVSSNVCKWWPQKNPHQNDHVEILLAITQNRELQQLQDDCQLHEIPKTVDITFIYPVRYSRYAITQQVGNTTSATWIERQA